MDKGFGFTSAWNVVEQNRREESGEHRGSQRSGLKEHGNLACEACGFDLWERYGSRRNGFIECAITPSPFSAFQPGQKTKASDLALFCANCHPMVHAERPWLSTDELKAIVHLPCNGQVRHWELGRLHCAVAGTRRGVPLNVHTSTLPIATVKLALFLAPSRPDIFIVALRTHGLNAANCINISASIAGSASLKPLISMGFLRSSPLAF